MKQTVPVLSMVRFLYSGLGWVPNSQPLSTLHSVESSYILDLIKACITLSQINAKYLGKVENQ